MRCVAWEGDGKGHRENRSVTIHGSRVRPPVRRARAGVHRPRVDHLYVVHRLAPTFADEHTRAAVRRHSQTTGSNKFSLSAESVGSTTLGRQAHKQRGRQEHRQKHRHADLCLSPRSSDRRPQMCASPRASCSRSSCGRRTKACESNISTRIRAPTPPLPPAPLRTSTRSQRSFFTVWLLRSRSTNKTIRSQNDAQLQYILLWDTESIRGP